MTASLTAVDRVRAEAASPPETARRRGTDPLRRTAVGATVAVAGLHLATADHEARVIAAGLAAGAALLFLRSGLAGRIVLLVLLVDVLAWMAPAAWSNATHGEAVGQVALPVALAVLPALGVLSVVAGWRGVGNTRSALGAVVAAVLLGAVAVAVAQLSGGGSSTAARPGDLRISARNAGFSTGRLQAGPGSTGIVVTNHDLFWHTFTIEDLSLDVRVPVGATRRVVADLVPGTYTFACAIPGHRFLGMKGTLVVR